MINHKNRSYIKKLITMGQTPDLLVDMLNLLLNQITKFDTDEDFKLIDACKIKYKKLFIKFSKQ